MKTFAIFCIVYSVVFTFSETAYFGGNILPQSIEEAGCDLVGILLCAAGYIIFKSSK